MTTERILVTIVARTRMGSGACIGGITADGRSVRLIASDAAFNDYFNLDYRIGEVWEIEADRPEEVIPPHVENVIVRHKHRIGMADDLPGLIERHMPAAAGGLDVLYDGLLQASRHGPLYITQRTGIPAQSTLFWRPDRPLRRDTSGKRIHYRYPAPDGDRTLTFVGFQEPVEEIPPGTLVRVSLAHWWRPVDRPQEEVRCYAQLSGWIEEHGPLPGPLPTGEGTKPLFPAPLPTGEGTRRPLPDPRSVGEGIRFPSLGEGSGEGNSLAAARLTLKRVFGYDEFRPLQETIIGNVLTGRDSLAVMPTGSGKSLCYQLPALLFPGLTVVVSPLISLMEDQVMQLRELDVAAAYLNSTLDYGRYVAIADGVAAGRYRLLYTAPETLLRPETLALLDRCRVDCLTIDEAHCISEWGHDFRPEYRQLAQVRRRLPDAVCLAVTATATERVRRDIRGSLDIPDADEFVSSFDRENLFLTVEPRDNGLAQTLAFLEGRRNQAGIIYCATRERVDTLAAQLNDRGWPALPYHAGMDTDDRRANQRRFSYDEAPIIVATIAFGMGINKSNVRFVVHHDLPKDLESYYQQIGRAGRDGLRADCLLLYSYQDVSTITYFIDQGDPAQRPAAMARLQAMLAFAEANDCRRRPLLAYFGEEVIRETCDMCDNCVAGEEERIDLTIPAQKFLSCVRRTGEIFGAGHVIDVLRGSKAAPVLSRGHERLSTYGIGEEYSRKEWQQLARQFVRRGLLAQDMEHGSLSLTDMGWAVLKGESFLGVPPAAERRAVREAAATEYDTELFEQLRQLRLRLAREAGVPPYIIFPDAALADMAAYYPQSPERLGRMQGVGATKLARYGDAILGTIRAYAAERGLEERRKPEPAARAARPLRTAGTRRDEVVKLYREGRAASEIAGIFGVTLGTVVSHLWKALQDGSAIDAGRLLADCALEPGERARVLAAFDELGAERLRPIYEALGERVTYDQLRLLQVYYVARALEHDGTEEQHGSSSTHSNQPNR